MPNLHVPSLGVDGAGLHLPNADDVVGVTSEQSGAISGPSQRDTLDGDGLLGLLDVGLQFIDADLGFQIPNLDGRSGRGTQPVADGREDQSMNDITSVQRRQVATFVQVPQHRGTVLTTRSTQGTIGGHGHGVDIASVANQVGLELAHSQVPDLHHLIPTSGDDQRSGQVGRESHTRHPFTVTILGDDELALAQSVPQVDCLISRTRHDLTVIGGESDRQDILGVTIEVAGRGAGVEVPQAEGTIPRATQSELTIRRDGDIANVMRVTL